MSKTPLPLANATMLLPIPTNVSKDRIHVFAEHICDQLELAPGDSLDPPTAALGGRIVYQGASETGSPPPSIEVRNVGDFTIFLPSNTSQTRDRFTIAHELGHLFLHFPLVHKQNESAVMRATRWVDHEDPVQRRAEWEANWFASAFLMPSEKFTYHWNKLKSLPKIAKLFGVSEQAATYRIKALGLTES